MSANGETVTDDGVWVWSMDSCSCDWCKTFVSSAISEARLNRSTWAMIRVNHDDVSNVVMVENWSRREDEEAMRYITDTIVKGNGW